MTGIHDSLTVIDGLVISEWSRAVFADMRQGGLTAANCTCSIWEGFTDTMRNIAQWKRWFTDHADLISPVRVTTDIRRAKAEGKTGIILGFQNTSALEDQVGYIPLFKELGWVSCKLPTIPKTWRAPAVTNAMMAGSAALATRSWPR
jgi:membrane dipeptidase